MGYKLDEVYGLTRDLPLNYVEREEVDEAFRNSLKRNKHIIIFGSSKQGKTYLKKHCLRADEYINIQCNNKMTLTEINTSILKKQDTKLRFQTEKQLVEKLKF